MAVGTKRLAVHPSLGDSIGGLPLSKTQQLGDDSGGRDLDENNVVEADLVVGVLQSQDTLDLVSLDHGLQNIMDLQNFAVTKVSTGAVGARDPVGHSQDTT